MIAVSSYDIFSMVFMVYAVGSNYFHKDNTGHHISLSNQKFVVYINKMYKYGNIYDYSGKKVCVTGTIKSYRSMPEIINPYTLELQN